ncbi:amidase [Geomicrobium sediminis]|uniref:Amidase n=1 Tax=Geomicrobium sediminis TaxID=1347788 RepID=A0ABS2PI94_9BACL|nr:amidase [Geomicrobium sediminis]
MSSLVDLTTVELVAMIKGKEVSSYEVVSAFIKQIETYNPSINAIVSFQPEYALSEARKADERFAKGNVDGPLHGIPMAFKDTHDAKGFKTTKGCTVLQDNVAKEDELLVSRLRRAGAIGIGKTNVPEFAAGSHTFNPVFGLTRNPYNLEKSAGGSSGGAAAALAARMIPLADGSDMGGSCRNPAAFNNVVGLRPSPGRVPTYPKANGFGTLSVQGPLAKTVSDVAYMMSVIAGYDKRVPIALREEGTVFLQRLELDVKKVKIAYSEDLGGLLALDEPVRKAFKNQLAVWESLGCELVDVAPDLAEAADVFETLRAFEMEAAGGAFVEQHRAELKTTYVKNVEKGMNLTGPEVGRALRKQTELVHEMARFFSNYDFLMLPTTQVEPFDANVEYPTMIAGEAMKSYTSWMQSCSLISVLNTPAISIPGGFTENGLPFGLQLVAPIGQDFELLQLAHVYESVTKHYQKQPKMNVEESKPL